MNISDKIKFYRKKEKISQRELGRRIGKTGQFISLIENGNSKPSINTLEEIARTLNIPISTLLDDKTFDSYVNSRIKYIEQVNYNANNMSSKIINDDPHLIVQFSEEYRNKQRENEELSQKYFSTLIEHETSKVDSIESFFKLILSWLPWDDLDELDIKNIDELVNSLTLMYNFKMYEFSQISKNKDE